MKKEIIKIITLLVFALVAVSSCSLSYRQHRREVRVHERDRGHDGHNEHHYNRYES